MKSGNHCVNDCSKILSRTINVLYFVCSQIVAVRAGTNLVQVVLLSDSCRKRDASKAIVDPTPEKSFRILRRLTDDRTWASLLISSPNTFDVSRAALGSAVCLAYVSDNATEGG